MQDKELDKFRYREIRPSEQRPNGLEQILARFGREDEREKDEIRLQVINQTDPLLSAVLRINNQEFRLVNLPQECPHYGLVRAGAIAVGLSNPTDLERLDEVLCGHALKQEDTIGPLSGRCGTNYEAKSQCWRIAGEAIRLVRFMNEAEEAPELEDLAEKDEEGARKLLNRRKQVATRNTSRQMVFTTWQKLRREVSLQKEPNEDLLQLSPPKLEPAQNTVGLTEEKRVVDVSDQLRVGGHKYEELTRWVEAEILEPLINLVGQKTLALELGSKRIWIRDNTAENCPKRPYTRFFGSIS